MTETATSIEPQADWISPPPPAVRYRALSPLAVVSVVLGVLSILTAFASAVDYWLLSSVVPLAGIILGWRALVKIRTSPEEWTGLKMAWSGMLLSLALWMAGSMLALANHAREVPWGYQRVSYEMLQPDPSAPTEPIPQSALDMQDKKVFLKGYMQSRRQQVGIKEFILCPTNGECPFCIPNPKMTEKVRVILQGDLETAYTTHQIGVAGRFQVDLNDSSGVPYSVEADQLR